MNFCNFYGPEINNWSWKWAINKKRKARKW